MSRLLVSVIGVSVLLAGSAWSQQFTSALSPTSSAAAEGALHLAGPTASGGALPRAWTASVNAPILASPKLADLTGDGVAEVLLTTYGITNPYGEGYLHAWNNAGASMSGFPIKLVGAAPGTVAVGDLDHDGDVELVQGTWTDLYVFNHDASIYSPWPVPLYVTQNAALADLDGDRDLEIIVPSANTMYVFNHDTSFFPGVPMVGQNDLTAAALGDLDLDGDLEIVAGSFVASGSASDLVYAWHHDGTGVTGFPVTTSGSVKAPPALADLDGDGVLEVIADCWNKSGTDVLYVWDNAGKTKPGWPLSVAYIRLSSPTTADLDLDGDLEILVGGWAGSAGEVVNAFHHTGAAVLGFPVKLNNSPSGNVNSSLAAGDIDGDGYQEIVVKAVNNIYALNHDGSLAAGFPVFLDDTSHSGTTSPTPALGDADGDGHLEIFAATCYSTVALLDQNGVSSPDALAWPSFRRDHRNSGTYAYPTLATDAHTLSQSAGGILNFSLAAGKANANRYYLIIGSLTGTAPGWPLPGGKTVVPLNWDVFSFMIANYANSPALVNFLGKLDGSGKSSALLNSFGPLPPGVIGVKLYFAYFCDFPWNFASNYVEIVISP